LQLAIKALTESYGILTEIGRLDAICYVGTRLGQAWARAGNEKAARAVLQRSLDGFRKLGHAKEVTRVREMLRHLG
jgi:hypothetical protein